MKFLHLPALDQLSNVLSDLPTSAYRVITRVEAYSVKSTAEQKKRYKEMEDARMTEQDQLAAKIHFYMISLLNIAFPTRDFSSVEPNRFTREPSAAHVLSALTNQYASYTGGEAPQIIRRMAMSPSLRGDAFPGVLSSSFSSSPMSSPPHGMARTDLYRILSDYIPLDSSECEVYSWFPEPEYDPYNDEDDEEMSEDDFDRESTVHGDEIEELDSEDPSWGHAGMELDDSPGLPKRSRGLSEDGMARQESYPARRRIRYERKKSRLLWSRYYFFYSKREQRMLFYCFWGLQDPSDDLPSYDEDASGAFPMSISSMPIKTKSTRIPARSR